MPERERMTLATPGRNWPATDPVESTAATGAGADSRLAKERDTDVDKQRRQPVRQQVGRLLLAMPALSRLRRM